MPDWEQILRQRLSPLHLSPGSEEQVIAELAAHFEELYGEQIDAGLPADRALDATLAQVKHWKRFRRDLQCSKEDPMNRRTRAFWFPGLFSCLLSYLSLALIVRAGLRPQLVWLSPDFGVGFYLTWFAPLPVVGALAAWWSRRAGGARLQRMLAVLLPSICTAVLCVIIFFVALLFERHRPVDKMLVSWLVGLLAWAGLPGVALLLGALPFLGSSPSRDHPAAAQG